MPLPTHIWVLGLIPVAPSFHLLMLDILYVIRRDVFLAHHFELDTVNGKKKFPTAELRQNNQPVISLL